MDKSIYLSVPIDLGISVHQMELFQEILRLCERIRINVYAPHLAPDPDQPDPALGEIIEARVHRLFVSDLLVAYFSEPSLEIRWDITLAKELHLPIIILCDRAVYRTDTVLDIHRNVERLEFNNLKEAIDELEIALIRWQWKAVCG